MTSKQWQLGNEAAERYEAILVPAILGPFAEALVDAANLEDSELVVDIGCGTGAATRYAATKMKPSAKITGIDVNTGMLAVAQSLPAVKGASIEWMQDNAYELSLDDDSVDAVLCAQVLQFMKQGQDAISEMWRILKKGQSLYLSLWSLIEESPYFDALVKAVANHINEDTAAGLGSAFNLSDADEIRTLMEPVFSDVEFQVSELNLDLPSVGYFVPRHILATPMGAGYLAAPEATQQAILDELTETLSDYQFEGRLRVPFRSHIIIARK